MPKPTRPATHRAAHQNLTRAPDFCPVCVDGSLAILYDVELASYACASCRRPDVRRMPRIDPHRGYQEPEASVSGIRKAVFAAGERLEARPRTMKQKRQDWKDGTFSMNVTAGEIPGVVRRVKRRDEHNKPRTFDQAVAIAEQLPWYPNAVYAGQSGGYYLWRERQAIP